MMYRKTALLCVCMLLTSVFGACSNETTDSDQAASATEATTEAAPVSRNLYYVSNHGTTDPAELESFRTQLETDGYSWNEITLTEIPADADAVMLCAPQEDITKEEMDALDAYMDAGGHLLLLMPASDEEVRYKYLSQFLEPFCIVIDYDRISETDESHMMDGDPYYIQTEYVARPDNMPLYSADAESGIVHFHDARSFYFVYQDHFSVVKQDVILKTSATVIGEPYGGVEDDPMVYEDTALNVMGYARNEERSNSSIVFIGAADFLTDDNYTAETAVGAVSWLHSALEWFVLY